MPKLTSGKGYPFVPWDEYGLEPFGVTDAAWLAKVLADNQGDPTANYAVRMACKWASQIEDQMLDDGAKLEAVALATLEAVDTDDLRASNMLLNWAVNFLGRVWEHGDDLCAWHQARGGHPAVITVQA